MKHSLKKIISTLLAVIMVFGVLIVAPFTVNATQSRTGNFNKNFSLSGNGADDIVSVAAAQLGKTGSQLGYSEQWCADFVSDCAKLANQADAIPTDGRCSVLRKNIKDAGGDYVSIYEAKKGDIVFYGNNGADHVEIVYAASNGNISTYGGNSGSGTSLYTRSVKQHATQTQSIAYVVRPNYSNPILPDPEVENWFYHGATDHSDFRPVISFINPETVSSVKFAVRYDTGDWKWYNGEFNGSNAWFCDVLSNDLGVGNYIICHAYVYGKNGSYKGYPYTELTLGKDANPSVQTWYYDGATEHSDFRPVIRFDNPETVSSVKFAVRYDTGDWKWYDGMYNGRNAWYCDVLSDDLGSGNYILCHGYVYANNGSYKGYPFVNLKLDKDYEDPSLNNWYYTIDIQKKEINYIIDFSNPETVSNVRFAIRTENTDWEWYDGTYNGDNEWYFTVQIDGYEEGEIIYCHCYVKGRNGFYDGYPYPEAEVKIKHKIGDVDGDSNVEIKDTTMLQKYLAGLVSFSDEQLALADTNGDGSVTVLDATQIQKYLANLITELG